MKTENKIEKYLVKEAKMSMQDIADVVENEGLGYAIKSYLSWKSIEDKQLAKLWKAAGDVMNKIESILSPYMP